MRRMPAGNISAVDLNLLVALDALLAERSVTRAAGRIGLTQPALSRALARLRAVFGDALLVRTSHGMAPTRRALELAEPLRRTLDELQSVLAGSAAFDPMAARRRFRIAAVDYAQVTVLAPLLARLATQAPLVDIEIRHPSPESERDLESGALDLLLALRQASGPAIVWSPLCDDGYTCVVWKEHPCKRLTPESFAAMNHVLVAPRERPGGVVDEILAARRLTRRVAVQVSTFLFLPHVLIGTDRIATVPTRTAQELTRLHPLRSLRPPIDVPGFTICSAWHEIHRDDLGHRWLRGEVARIARGARRA